MVVISFSFIFKQVNILFLYSISQKINGICNDAFTGHKNTLRRSKINNNNIIKINDINFLKNFRSL